MEKNFWKQDDEEEFNDVPEEVQGQDAPPVRVQVQQTSPVVQTAAPQVRQAPVQQVQEQEEIDEDYTDVLSDARLRLEQGRLYEMIMNHNLFEGVESDEKAIKTVQKQIRNFAKEQMEIMLGMRQEKTQEEMSVSVELPFNDLEIRTLKALASTATRGASATPEADAEKYITEPTRTTLNPINSGRTANKPATVRPTTRPLANKPTEPVKRVKRDMDMERILREEGVSKEELEAVFPPDYKPLDKHPSQLKDQEVIDRNKAARAGKPVKSPFAIPMPNEAQEEIMYTSRANQAAANPQMQTIMNLLNNNTKK